MYLHHYHCYYYCTLIYINCNYVTFMLVIINSTIYFNTYYDNGTIKLFTTTVRNRTPLMVYLYGS